MKDIFIDTNMACKFSKPDQTYQDFINWLLSTSNNGYMMGSKHLRNEYEKANRGCVYGLLHIYLTLFNKGRINFKTVTELENFKSKHIDKRMWSKLRSKANDKENIPLVLLSNRKYVISNDNNFLYDLINFPKFGKQVSYSKCVTGFNYQ